MEYCYVCTDKASNVMATDPEQARKRRRASCGISLAGILVTAIIVVTAVIADLKTCKYIVRGGCYRFKSQTVCGDDSVYENTYCYYNLLWNQCNIQSIFLKVKRYRSFIPYGVLTEQCLVMKKRSERRKHCARAGCSKVRTPPARPPVRCKHTNPQTGPDYNTLRRS